MERAIAADGVGGREERSEELCLLLGRKEGKEGALPAAEKGREMLCLLLGWREGRRGRSSGKEG